ILDNAETITAEARERLIELCAATIITSRTAIDPTGDIPVDRLSDEDALKLLASRKVDVAAQTADALKLIRRLGGLALALEITAKRMAVHRPRQSCAAALDDLNQSRHLVEALRLPRHQNREDNLAEAFALSYRTLDDESRAVFHAIGLCAQTSAPIAGLAAMLDIEPAAVRDTLIYLAELSLADFDGAQAIAHPLLHDYAQMCAEQDLDRAAEMIERHVRHFGLEIGGAYQRVLGKEDGENRELKQIDEHLDNVRLAQVRAMEEGFNDPALAVELTVDLQFYWRLRDEPDVFDWLCRAEQLAKQVGSNLGQANVLKAIGDVQSFRDEKDAALASYASALTLFKQVGSNLGQANVLLALARSNGNAEQFEAAIKLYEKIGDRYSIARGKAFYGQWLIEAGKEDRAIALLLEAREGFLQINFEPGVNFMDDLLAAMEEENDEE
nr:hypothetical protein [Acidobacteriota bacterium]